ncbi:DUF397 domain-containing protein [Kitasatospora sp. NPDC089913]|uniref:DUF397 domain-containing protein n=1 Tax=Kitasatospora sp. NPDC089913 TaxID=3364080 RepID=UPI003823E2ED
MANGAWQKSSRSASSNECVEVRAGVEVVEFRESDYGETILRVTPAAATALLHAIKAGELDHHG